MTFEISVINDFAQIETEWTKLLPQAITNKIFLHPIYQKTWWETLGQGSLQISTVRNEQRELVGLVPLFIHDHRAGFVGCKDVSDYLDFVVHREYQAEIYPLLVKQMIELFEQQGVTEIELCSLPAASPTLQYVQDLIKQTRPTAHITMTQQDVCPRIELPRDFDTYLQSLGKKQRHEIKRKMRKLTQEAKFSIEAVTTIDQSSNLIDVFIHLHQLSSPDKHDFWSDEHRRFFELLLPRCAEQGWLKLFFLHITQWRDNSFDLPLPTQPAAAMLIFDYDSVYNLYNSGYNPQYRQLSVGQILTTMTIEHAIQNKRAVYDFLRGNEEYKFRLGGKPIPVMDLTISLGTD